VHPPNTAAAYAAALVHTDCIEVDASLTSDHQLVAMHDRDLEQLLNKPGAKVGVLNFKVVFCVLLHNAVTRAMNDRDLEQLLNKPSAKVCNVYPEGLYVMSIFACHRFRSTVCRNCSCISTLPQEAFESWDSPYLYRLFALCRLRSTVCRSCSHMSGLRATAC
jgi:hypothetical protein